MGSWGRITETSTLKKLWLWRIIATNKYHSLNVKSKNVYEKNLTLVRRFLYNIYCSTNFRLYTDLMKPSNIMENFPKLQKRDGAPQFTYASSNTILSKESIK